jgi:ankyrin repeat protein
MSLSTEFFRATMLGQTARIQALLDQHPSLAFSRSDRGSTALHAAAHHGHREVAKLLLAYGAAIEARSRFTGLQGTTLHEAVLMNQVEMAHLLLQHGTDVQARNALGWMPLHMAVLRGNAAMVRLLLANGAPADVKDGTRRTARQLALWRDNVEVIATLQEAMTCELPAKSPAPEPLTGT